MKLKDFEEELNIDKPEVELEEVRVTSTSVADDFMTDYKLVREKLTVAMVRGQEILDEAVKQIKVDPHARGIEAASSALKSFADSGKELLNLHDKILDIEKKLEIENEDEEKKVNRPRTNMKEIISIVDKKETASN